MPQPTPYGQYRLTDLQVSILEHIRASLCGDIAGLAVDDWLLGYFSEFQDLSSALATYRPLGENEQKVANLYQDTLSYFQQANQMGTKTPKPSNCDNIGAKGGLVYLGDGYWLNLAHVLSIQFGINDKIHGFLPTDQLESGEPEAITQTTSPKNVGYLHLPSAQVSALHKFFYP